MLFLNYIRTCFYTGYQSENCAVVLFLLLLLQPVLLVLAYESHVMTSWLVRYPRDRVVQVQALARALCRVLRQNT